MPETLLGTGAIAVNDVNRNSYFHGAWVLVKWIQAINKTSINIMKKNKVEKNDDLTGKASARKFLICLGSHGERK